MNTQTLAAGGGRFERGVRRAVVAALAFACAGCSVGERTNTETPKGWRAFVAGGNHVTYVAPVTMEDGPVAWWRSAMAQGAVFLATGRAPSSA